MATRRAPIFGPETWATCADRAWSYWDLWMCVVAVCDAGGDLNQIEARLVTELYRPGLGSSTAAEAKLSHLAHLRGRLDAAGLAPGDLVGDAASDMKVVRKARHKLAATEVEGRAMTEPMRETPRARLQRRARFGAWDGFQVSPTPFYEELRGLVEVDRHIPKRRTFAVTRTLGKRLQRVDGPRRSPAERIALYRAFHTAGLELADRADDSYGNIGELRHAAWRTYLGLDWRAAGIGPELWWRDLCELIVWEPYALGHKHETLPYASAPVEEVPVIESILTELAAEHEGLHLRWQADAARQQLAWLHVATRGYEQFPRIAASLGSEHWMPIDAMARTALDAGMRHIAIAVFEAADRPGFQQGYLRRRCRELTGVSLGDEELPPRPRLRVVHER